MAAKWWGPRNIQPINALHGWQDNAGTFDNLIPLLPDYVGYLAIDFPGHGFSSKSPHGTFYSTIDYVYMLHIVVKKYKWEKVCIIGHSLGSIVSFLYAAIFPDQCGLIVGLDALKVHVQNNGFIMSVLTNMDELYRFDVRNQDDTYEPASYMLPEVLNIVENAGYLAVSREFAPHLLKRGISQSKIYPDQFYFTRDSRLKCFNVAMLSHETCLQLAARVKCPHLFLKSIDAPLIETKIYYDEAIEVLRKNKYFEYGEVAGPHHAHLTHAPAVAEKISSFIEKYYPPNYNNCKL